MSAVGFFQDILSQLPAWQEYWQVYLCANFMYMTETNNYAPNTGNQGAEGAEDTREEMNTDENISGFTHLNEMGANDEELDGLRCE